jgi:hypothetical protein
LFHRIRALAFLGSGALRGLALRLLRFLGLLLSLLSRRLLLFPPAPWKECRRQTHYDQKRQGKMFFHASSKCLLAMKMVFQRKAYSTEGNGVKERITS